MLNVKRCKNILLTVLAIITCLLLIKIMPKIMIITSSLDEFKDYILSAGHFGIIVSILFQVIQTVVAPIPGEVVQITSGYLYGTIFGTGYSLIGLIIGAAIAFYFTRLIGRKTIENVIERKKLAWIKRIMESDKLEIILFIIFIVPGLPKDFMMYVAGLTDLKPIKFFGILILSRLPWIVISVGIGTNIDEKNYVFTIIVSILAIGICVLGMFYKNKIIEKLSK